MHITSKITQFLFRNPALRTAAGPAAPMRGLAGWQPAVRTAAILAAPMRGLAGWKPAVRIAAILAAPMRGLAGWKPAVLIAAILAASSVAAVPFRQLSNPTGIVADQTVEVSPGETVSTV